LPTPRTPAGRIRVAFDEPTVKRNNLAKGVTLYMKKVPRIGLSSISSASEFTKGDIVPSEH